MKEQIEEILDIDGVAGVFFFSLDGSPVFQRSKKNRADRFTDTDWSSLISALETIKETELIYDNLMIYLVRGRTGYMIVTMDRFAPIAMVRLNCGIVLPEIEKKFNKPKGLGRFFKK
jgi:hypothetical protein